MSDDENRAKSSRVSASSDITEIATVRKGDARCPYCRINCLRRQSDVAKDCVIDCRGTFSETMEQVELPFESESIEDMKGRKKIQDKCNPQVKSKQPKIVQKKSNGREKRK